MWGLVLGVTNGACSKVQRNSTRCTEVHYCTAASARDGHVAHGNTLPVPCCPTRPCRRPLHEVARARATYDTPGQPRSAVAAWRMISALRMRIRSRHGCSSAVASFRTVHPSCFEAGAY